MNILFILKLHIEDVNGLIDVTRDTKLASSL
jgi:hypothetical protein